MLAFVLVIRLKHFRIQDGRTICAGRETTAVAGFPSQSCLCSARCHTCDYTVADQGVGRCHKCRARLYLLHGQCVPVDSCLNAGGMPIGKGIFGRTCRDADTARQSTIMPTGQTTPAPSGRTYSCNDGLFSRDGEISLCNCPLSDCAACHSEQRHPLIRIQPSPGEVCTRCSGGKYASNVQAAIILCCICLQNLP